MHTEPGSTTQITSPQETIQPVGSSTTTPNPPINSSGLGAALGGAVGGCVALLILVALTIGVVAVLFKYFKPKSYFGVERTDTVAYNNSIYGFEGGKDTAIIDAHSET